MDNGPQPVLGPADSEPGSIDAGYLGQPSHAQGIMSCTHELHIEVT